MPSDFQLAWMDRNAGRAADLAIWLSLASLADPGFVRRARRALDLPVSAELELRASPLISSAGVEGIVLAEEVLPHLRARLLESGRIDDAWRLLAERHAAISPALAMEERLTYRALQPGYDAAAAENELKQALFSIVREGRTHLAAWAARALPRFPQQLRQMPSAGYLASAVQANGFSNRPSVAVQGPPPPWMSPVNTSGGFEGGLSLSGSSLDITYPRRVGDDFVLLPSDLRIWVSWTGDGGRVTREAVIRKGVPTHIEIEGDEFEIATSLIVQRFSRVQQQETPNPKMVFFAEPARALTGGEQDLFAFLRFQLAMRGHMLSNLDRARWVDRWDFFLLTPIVWNSWTRSYVATGGSSQSSAKSSEMFGLPADISPPEVMGRIVLAPDSSSLELPDTPASYSLATIDFQDRSRWDQGVQELLSALDTLPSRSLGELHGVPPIPENYVRRADLADEVASALYQDSMRVINLFGRRGSGRTTEAASAVSSPQARRYFSDGIYWLGKDAPLLSPPQRPRLIVITDPRVEDYRILSSAPGASIENGSCLLVLTREDASEQLSCSGIDAGTWTPEELTQLFRRAANLAPAIEVSSDLVWDVSQQTPRGAVHLAQLIRTAQMAGHDVSTAIQAFDKAEEPLAQACREAIFELDLLQPLLALPPDWEMPAEMDTMPVAEAYFVGPFHTRIGEAHRLFRAIFTDARLPLPVSDALHAMAVETHRRIVAFYRAQCGGDWAIGPDDGYFFQHFAYHFLCALPEDPSELTENPDWKGRADKIAPDWLNDLPPSRSHMVHGSLLFNVSKDLWTGEPGERNMLRARDELARLGPSCWVLVFGTGDFNLPPGAYGASRAIGRELARWGYGLISGGWQGVDNVVAQAYSEQLKASGIAIDMGLRTILGEEAEDRFDLGSFEVDAGSVSADLGSNEARRRDWQYQALHTADLVVAIAGGGWTLAVCRAAAGMGKPVFPIPGSGGDAARFFREMEPQAAQRLSTLDMPLNSNADFYEVAKRLVSLLPNPSERVGPRKAKPAGMGLATEARKDVGSAPTKPLARNAPKEVAKKAAKKTTRKFLK